MEIYFKENLILLRRLRNMTQKELAGMLGIAQGAISNYEAGTIEPRLTNLIKMAGIFGIDVDTFLSDDLSKISLQDILNENTKRNKRLGEQAEPDKED